MVILGIIGRICSGKETFTRNYQLNHNIDSHILKGYDYKTLFESDYKVEEVLQQWLQDQQKYAKTQNKMICENSRNNWNQNQIICNLTQLDLVQFLLSRSYFHLVLVECPVLQRYKNFQIKYPDIKINLEDFIFVDDYIYFNSKIEEIYSIYVKVKNSKSLDHLSVKILDKNLFNIITFRPTFDDYFMRVAIQLKKRSNCMKRSVGVVLTVNNRIISSGYNGTPGNMVNCYKGGCERCNSNAKQGVDLDKCLCIHAEENCILECGIQSSKGGTLYSTLFPCTWCSKIIIQAKISKLVYLQDFGNNDSIVFLSKHIQEIVKLEINDYTYNE